MEIYILILIFILLILLLIILVICLKRQKLQENCRTFINKTFILKSVYTVSGFYCITSGWLVLESKSLRSDLTSDSVGYYFIVE